MNIFKLTFLAICTVISFSCSGDDETNNNEQSLCDKEVSIDKRRYDNIDSDDFEIVTFSILEDCMKITIRTGACDGSNWVVDLVDSEGIDDSSPEQRYLKIDFSNPEQCEALIEKEFTFDVFQLRIGDTGELILNVEGAVLGIRYIY